MSSPVGALIHGLRKLHAIRRDGKVGLTAQLRQLAHMRRVSRMSTLEFYRYRLWRTQLSELDRLCYVTYEDRRLSGRKVNPVAGRDAITWKSQAIARFHQGGAPTPELLALIDPAHRSIEANVERVRTPDALADVLAQAPSEGIVIKPEDGRRGHDVLVGVAASRDGLHLVDGALLSIATIWRRVEAVGGMPWRVERRVVAHPEIMGYRSDIVPSVRVQMVVADGTATMLCATLKVPRGDSGIDNLAFGNLGAPIDLSNWTSGVAMRVPEGSRYPVHPDTGVAIAGRRLPLRREVEAAAKSAALALMPLRCVGFDVALGAGGPVVFEGNWRFGGYIVQMPQDEGMFRGAYLRMIHEVGADDILAGRRRYAEWREFEARELANA